MRIAERSQFGSADFQARDHDLKIMLGYVVFMVALLIAIYAAANLPGTAPGDLASMLVFP